MDRVVIHKPLITCCSCQLRPKQLQLKQNLRFPPYLKPNHHSSLQLICHSLSEALDQQLDVNVQYDVEDGSTIRISALSPEDVRGVAVVLTRSFATTLPSIEDGRKYAAEMLDKTSGAILLVMRLYPPTITKNEADQSPSNPTTTTSNNKPYRVIGMASLSFNRDTREEFPSLQPPDDAVYLSNIAIDLSYRRKGHARMMMGVCEDVGRRRSRSGEMYLHVRLVDEGAEALYRSLGYETVDQDAWLVKLRGLTPRKMMRKKLQMREGAG